MTETKEKRKSDSFFGNLTKNRGDKDKGGEKESSSLNSSSGSSVGSSTVNDGNNSHHSHSNSNSNNVVSPTKRPVSLYLSSSGGDGSTHQHHGGTSLNEVGLLGSLSSKNSSPTSSPPASRRSSGSQFKLPPKTGSVLYSIIYDKSSTGIEKIDEEDLVSRVNLQRVIVSKNKLTEIPNRISELTKLVTLDLSYNRLKSLPVSMSTLPELATLLLAGNQFMIPAKNDNTTNANTPSSTSTSTTTTGNNTPPPESIVSHSDVDDLTSPTLQTSQELQQKEDQPNHLPAEYGYISSLTKLDLSSNIAPGWDGENYLPPSLFWYSQISTLYLSHCRLQAVSTDIQHLQALTYLDLSYNRLKEVPSELGMLRGLTYLSIRHNHLEWIPGELGNLENLTTFDIGHNRLKELPSEIRYLGLLETFNASFNRLTSIPSSLFGGLGQEEDGNVYSLYSLRDFKIRCNQITELPEPFFSLGCPFSHLDLSDNQLKELPNVPKSTNANTSSLESLTTLLLFNNQLKKLPANLFNQAPSLTTLNLCDNQLEEFSATIWQDCPSLSQLSLGYNPNLKALAFPKDSFYSLEELYLNGNEQLAIGAADPTVEYFPSLRELSMASCKWTQVPRFIYLCRSLEKLDLSNNLLKTVDWTEFRQCENLQVLSFSCNQLDSIPFDDILASLSNLFIFDVSFNLLTFIPDIYLYNHPSSPSSPSSPLSSPRGGGAGDHQGGGPAPGPMSRSSSQASINTKTNSLHLIYHHNRLAKNGDLADLIWTPSKRFNFEMAEMIGRRPTMEDAFSIRGNFSNSDTMDLVTLFDGHAGPRAATYSCEWFPVILKTLIDRYPSLPPQQWVKQAYSEVSLQFKHYIAQEKPELKYCGATAAAILINERYYFVSNIGDTRIVLCRNNRAIRLSFDHKPNDQKEEARIRRAGGFVISSGDTARVNGTLAVSRSIGDFYMEPFVIPDPHLSITESDKSADQFIIVACDGVWDEIGDQAACDIVLASPNMRIAAQRLRDYSFFRGSDDNITCIIINLKNPSP